MIYKIDTEATPTPEYIIKRLLSFKESNEGRKQIGQHHANVTSLVKPTIKNNINRTSNVWINFSRFATYDPSLTSGGRSKITWKYSGQGNRPGYRRRLLSLQSCGGSWLQRRPLSNCKICEFRPLNNTKDSLRRNIDPTVVDLRSDAKYSFLESVTKWNYVCRSRTHLSQQQSKQHTQCRHW